MIDHKTSLLNDPPFSVLWYAYKSIMFYGPVNEMQIGLIIASSVHSPFFQT